MSKSCLTSPVASVLLMYAWTGFNDVPRLLKIDISIKKQKPSNVGNLIRWLFKPITDISLLNEEASYLSGLVNYAN